MRRSPSSRWKTVLLAPLLAGCAIDHVAFRPREHVDAESPGGHPAASYRLLDDPSARNSELRLWSPGVDRVEGGSVVRVGFEIENRFTSPLVLDLDRTSLVDVDTGGDGDGEFAPTTVDGETAVEPDAVALVELTFELPPGTEPADVRAFAVRWVLRGAASVDEYTAFRRDLRRFRRPYGYGYGFYTGFPLFYFRGPFGGAGRLCW